MNIIWGLIIPAVGALFVTWGRTKSNFGLYRLLVARSRILWGDRVHGFYQIAGALCRDGLSDQEPTLRDRRRIEHLLECGRGESCPNSTG